MLDLPQSKPNLKSFVLLPSAVDQMNYMRGGTNTADGIKYLRENVFTTKGGARSNVPRIAVVITDGRSSNPTRTASEADLARKDNIGIKTCVSLFCYITVSYILMLKYMIT